MGMMCADVVEVKMKESWLKEQGYEIKNAKITNADLDMRDHGCMTMRITLDGDGWGVNYGGYCLGHGYLGAKEFDGSAKGMESIMRLMDGVGVECFSDLTGKYVRVATKGWGTTVKIIGNVIKDQWFDIEEFFKDGEV